MHLQHVFAARCVFTTRVATPLRLAAAHNAAPPTRHRPPDTFRAIKQITNRQTRLSSTRNCTLCYCVDSVLILTSLRYPIRRRLVVRLRALLTLRPIPLVPGYLQCTIDGEDVCVAVCARRDYVECELYARPKWTDREAQPDESTLSAEAAEA